MMYAFLIAVAASSPADWGSMIPRGPAPSGKVVLRTMALLQPPPGLPPAPLTFTLNVVPPGAAPYSVQMTFSATHACWEGVIPANAKSPFQNSGGGIYRIAPYEHLQATDPTSPTSYALLIRCNPPTGSADFGGGHIRHNPGLGFSAGPTHAYNFLGQGSVTARYTFTVGP